MRKGRLLLGELVAAEMDGGIADDATDGAFLAKDVEPAAAGGGDVGAADAINAQEALLGDVLDDEADLIGVGLEHDLARRGVGAIEGGPGAAVGVVLDAMGELAEVGGPFPLAARARTRWGWGSGEDRREKRGRRRPCLFLTRKGGGREAERGWG